MVKLSWKERLKGETVEKPKEPTVPLPTTEPEKVVFTRKKITIDPEIGEKGDKIVAELTREPEKEVVLEYLKHPIIQLEEYAIAKNLKLDIGLEYTSGGFRWKGRLEGKGNSKYWFAQNVATLDELIERLMADSSSGIDRLQKARDGRMAVIHS